MLLSPLYMSPSAFKTWFCDLPIHYMKSNEIQLFSAQDQHYEGFLSLFF